jgi:flagellin
MGMRVSTNLASINAQKNLVQSQREIANSFAQLSSGSRINKSADDAAGLAISEKLKSTIRGFRQAQRNANDATSMIQVAEGGMNEIANMLTRFRELGVQAASDNIGDTERGFINKEVQQLKLEIQRIAESTRFGDTHLLDGSGGKFQFQVDINNSDFQDRIAFDSGAQVATTDSLGVSDFDYSTAENARQALGVVEKAQIQVAGYRANLGALQNRLQSTQDNLGAAIENTSAANSRIRDTDIAAATADLTRNNIMLNAATTITAQANASPQLALKLLG